MLSKFDEGMSYYISEDYINALMLFKISYIEGENRALKFIIESSIKLGYLDEVKFFLILDSKDNYESLKKIIHLYDEKYDSIYKFLIDRAYSLNSSENAKFLGMYHYGYSQYHVAIKYFEEAISSGDKSLFCNLGDSLKEIERYEDAIESYRNGIKYKDFECYRGLAEVYTLLGRKLDI